jgi:hypothetical protein
MLHAGLDLRRKRLDFHLLDDAGETVDVGAAPPNVDGLRGLTARVRRHAHPVRAAIESMTGARFVHDPLEPLSSSRTASSSSNRSLHRRSYSFTQSWMGLSARPLSR